MLKATVSGVFEDLKFQKARTKIEVVLTLPCWLSQQKVLNCRFEYTLIPWSLKNVTHPNLYSQRRILFLYFNSYCISFHISHVCKKNEWHLYCNIQNSIWKRKNSKIYMTTKFIHSKDNAVFLALSMANQIGEWRNRWHLNCGLFKAARTRWSFF